MSPQVGDRVRLEFTNDKYTNLKPGDEGEVTFVDSIENVHVKWDNGSTLGLIPGVDRWTVIPQVS